MASPEFSPIQSQEGEIFKGDLAEDAVLDFFAQNFPNMSIRLSSRKEDQGIGKVPGGKSLDAVVYDKHKNGKEENFVPSIAIQITTNTDSKKQFQKMMELKEHPFMRLEDMKPSELSIPRAVIFVKTPDLLRYKQDPRFEKHGELSLQIIGSIINSLKFDLLQTKNPKEQEMVKGMIAGWEAEQQKLQGNKTGRPS